MKTMNNFYATKDLGHPKIPLLDDCLSSSLNDLVHQSNLSYIGSKTLGAPEPMIIRAGKAGGLPFDSLTTDVVSGCLSARQACYGICFAARSFWSQGLDFGVRVKNKLDGEVLLNDLGNLPATQRYLRNGWNSDPSWSWEQSIKLAEIIRSTNRLTIFITKAFTKTIASVISSLAKIGVEVRVSISAMDNDLQLSRRSEFMSDFRDAGGVAIPILMTASFKDTRLRERQERLVEWLTACDFPAAENSLRFPEDAPVARLVDMKNTRPIADSKDIWSGRLYSDRLVFPTTTTIPDWYEGLGSGFLSKLDKDFIGSLFLDPVMTNEEVMSSSESLHHPRQCGVAHVRSTF